LVDKNGLRCSTWQYEVFMDLVLEVSVTNEDIKNSIGHEGEYDKGPISRALDRLNCQNIDADEDRIILTYDGKRYLFKTPRIADILIYEFDRDREIKPIEFKLENPRIASENDERA